jgi:hypothetical protein
MHPVTLAGVRLFIPFPITATILFVRWGKFESFSPVGGRHAGAETDSHSKAVEGYMKDDDQDQYDLEMLKRLWKLDYESLAMAPGQGGGRLREARYILQTKVALETRSLIRSTFWLAVATVILAIATVALTVITFFK